jgi:hypothetical protein
MTGSSRHSGKGRHGLAAGMRPSRRDFTPPLRRDIPLDPGVRRDDDVCVVAYARDDVCVVAYARDDVCVVAYAGITCLVIPAKAGMGRPRDDGFFSSFRQRPAWAGLGDDGFSRHSGENRNPVERLDPGPGIKAFRSMLTDAGETSRRTAASSFERHHAHHSGAATHVIPPTPVQTGAVER